MVDKLPGNLYDYPSYYDLVYGSDWKAEHDFLIGAFDRFVNGGVQRVLEPACGTGRLIYRLMKHGMEAHGLDLSKNAVEYGNNRLERHGFPQTAVVADMCDFHYADAFDAGFNTINSFRHLESHDQAIAHLRCMSHAIKPGGIYVLGIHLYPAVGPPIEEESWFAQRGHLGVQTNMTLMHRNLDERYEQYKMRYDIWTPTNHQVLEDVFRFRTYTSSEFQQLLNEAGQWEIIDTYDFQYNLKQSMPIDDQTEDVVYILRRV